jgi:phosphoglycerate dehydrogenase-like enzyme
MRLAVHYLRPPYSEADLTDLRSQLHADVDLTVGPSVPAPAGLQILIAGRPQREQITASPNLRALIIPWAGLPETTRQLMLEFPHIAVHNLHHNALPVAEHALALLLAAAKFVVPMDRSLRSGDWTPRYQPNPSILLHGRTALILGFGAIGQQVARLCRGLGMDVVAVRRKSSGPSSATGDDVVLAPPEALHSLLPRADVLLVCLPHTPQTAGLIGDDELALLPPGAVLVNIGRGPIVDEGALYHALCEGKLSAAGLDVWYNYPEDQASRAHTPPSAYPFHELDNVVMSPHRGGGSTGTERLRRQHLAELLNAAARGESMPNRVDLEAGY